MSRRGSSERDPLAPERIPHQQRSEDERADEEAVETFNTSSVASMIAGSKATPMAFET